MNDIMLLKIVEKYDWNVLEMAREIQKQENMIEQLAERMQEDKKEKKELLFLRAEVERFRAEQACNCGLKAEQPDAHCANSCADDVEAEDAQNTQCAEDEQDDACPFLMTP